MLENLSNELDFFINRARFFVKPWLIVITGIWVFNYINWALRSPFTRLGIYPRNFFGLFGLIFCPFLHQNFDHLFFNTIPLFILGLVLLARGLEVFYWVTFAVAIGGGLLVWCFGRKALHIGASGVVSGYFGYSLFTAYFEPNFTSLILAIILIYYFGSILLGLFPSNKATSWESHLCGFIAGIGSAYIPLEEAIKIF